MKRTTRRKAKNVNPLLDFLEARATTPLEKLPVRWEKLPGTGKLFSI